ncbi:biotin-dependent carboxyltransferase family protein [Oceanobacillus bengalensis]|uniref:Biotin-dependent carboxyltransferase family protein n=1 Tax=Oceanobacillus bengalensis TaxID=1435466 RepID=A0A494Z3H7_9BACI|nr:biotin-dependent carboxyltransferase family protein [Oceanobacillus bengalensis]RKQ17060.1 biotin-dependent carboxyltransferase family protein [Oceanobacillus bengalensis]
MIHIIKPGLLTTVQDLGRYGYQKYGVITSGVMDHLAHRIANLLVGNEEKKATLEVTLVGPVIQFEKDALIALSGADLSPTINGKPVRMWRTLFVKKGSKLKFGRCRQGCRTYIAIAGGINVPKVMNSQSTYLRAGIGGFEGRALEADDRLVTGELSRLSKDITSIITEEVDDEASELDWSIATSFISTYSSERYLIRTMEGRQFDLFDETSRQVFFENEFKVTTQSDRMGYRLKGANLHVAEAGELISEAVAFGSVQVPSDGNPIILLADRQTTGGYPKIGQVATVDFSKLAQMKPGDKLRFKKITHEEAQVLYLEQEESIQQLRQGILLKARR